MMWQLPPVSHKVRRLEGSSSRWAKRWNGRTWCTSSLSRVPHAAQVGSAAHRARVRMAQVDPMGSGMAELLDRTSKHRLDFGLTMQGDFPKRMISFAWSARAARERARVRA